MKRIFIRSSKLIISFDNLLIDKLYANITCRVQISPAITLAQLFSLSTAWPLCVVLLLMQLSASVMAIAIFAVSDLCLMFALQALLS